MLFMATQVRADTHVAGKLRTGLKGRETIGPSLTGNAQAVSMRGVKAMRANGPDSRLHFKERGVTSLRLLTVEQVADMLQVPVSWVYARTRSRAADRIPGFRLGKYWRFRERDILNWLETQRS